MKIRKRTIEAFCLVCALSVLSGSCAVARSPVRIAVEENTVSVRSDERLLMLYRYDDVPFKPCVQKLWSPKGVNILRDAPADHLHHHALMFAVAVDGVNFWEEHGEPGRQIHRSFSDIRVDAEKENAIASFTEHIDWVNPRSKEVLLKEARTTKVCESDEHGCTMLAWRSKFEVPADKQSATLAGSRYFGLGMRFLKSMDTGGQFRNADGETGVEATNDKKARWCSYTAEADGKPVTIAIFDHPDNPRHPATWFTMEEPFAYLSATLNLYDEPLKLNSGQSLVLCYGAALWDGKVEADQIDKLSKAWSARPQ